MIEKWNVGVNDRGTSSFAVCSSGYIVVCGKKRTIALVRRKMGRSVKAIRDTYISRSMQTCSLYITLALLPIICTIPTMQQQLHNKTTKLCDTNIKVILHFKLYVANHIYLSCILQGSLICQHHLSFKNITTHFILRVRFLNNGFSFYIFYKMYFILNTSLQNNVTHSFENIRHSVFFSFALLRMEILPPKSRSSFQLYFYVSIIIKIIKKYSPFSYLTYETFLNISRYIQISNAKSIFIQYSVH